MITIICRELIDNIKNIRFILLVLFSILLFVLNGFLFTEKFREDTEIYAVRMSADPWGSSPLTAKIHHKPNPLLFIAEGGDQYLPYQYHLIPSGNITPLLTQNRDSRLSNVFELDWAFIIRFIFSLYVILLGYHAISGEKEEGTLGLTLSNPISRLKLLVSKYLSLMITVSVPLIIGITVNLIFIQIVMPEMLSGSVIARLGFMMFSSLVFLSIFAVLSLLLSSVVHQSSLVLLILMIIWLLFNISGDITDILTEELTPAQSELELSQVYDTLYAPNFNAEIIKRADSGLYKTVEELEHAAAELRVDFEKRKQQLITDYNNAMFQRAKLARNLARFSPVMLFQSVSESIAGTGIQGEINFFDDIHGYFIIFTDYISKYVGDNPLLLYDTYYHVIMNFEGEMIQISTLIFADDEQPEFDTTNFPVFQQTEPSLVHAINDALVDLSGLLLWNIVLALGAFIAFLYADVR
ncbi:MAG: ABC transporter permease subunit [Candidatus Latescibacteria bacterium]|nr:ABC transporter permease subunit [Candidatus Latescibacterota bacterium]